MKNLVYITIIVNYFPRKNSKITVKYEKIQSLLIKDNYLKETNCFCEIKIL